MIRVVFMLIALGWSAYSQVSTSQYDNARTGATLSETVLNPDNVTAQHFGKVGTLRVDGDVYAQPLYLSDVNIPGKGRRNVVFVATEHDSVYAFDADLRESAPLWHTSFFNEASAIRTLSARDVQCPFITPEIGITATPVIDPAVGTIYVLARSKEEGGSFGRFVQRLHALAVSTGKEKLGGPTAIRGFVPGRARDGRSGVVSFDPLHENPRAALLLSNHTVYLAWASSCDEQPYHGWVMAYDATTLSQKAVFNVSPDGSEGIVWVIASKGWRSPDQPAILYAYDANDITRELYSSSLMGRRDEAGKSLRFTNPTVVNGRVYVGAKGEVDVYGLLR